MGDHASQIVAWAAEATVVVGTDYGTLAAAATARRAGKSVVCLRAWDSVDPQESNLYPKIVQARSAREAVKQTLEAVSLTPPGFGVQL